MFLIFHTFMKKKKSKQKKNSPLSARILACEAGGGRALPSVAARESEGLCPGWLFSGAVPQCPVFRGCGPSYYFRERWVHGLVFCGVWLVWCLLNTYCIKVFVSILNEIGDAKKKAK